MNPSKFNILRGFLIIFGFICITIGLARGEEVIVLRKAIKICMECIGLG